MKTVFKEAPEGAFDRILADIGRSPPRVEKGGERSFNPIEAAAFFFVDSGGREASAWRDATDLFETDEPKPAAEFDRSVSDDPEAIAREIGLDQSLDEEELNRARRRFMWRNHPDRCAESQRALADRRVAIANMLIDRARARLAARRRSL
jgi:hypothetical protein